jgi:hypothetical protein
MKRIFFLIFLLFFTIATFAQNTTGFTAKADGANGTNNTFTVIWTFTQLSDTTSAFYSNIATAYQTGAIPGGGSFSLPDYNYYLISTTCSGFLMKQTKSTATPNTAVTLQGLYGNPPSTADTANISVLRAAHVAQTTGDTSGTFKFGRIANVYRIKLVNTGGRITSGKVALIFSKPVAKTGY